MLLVADTVGSKQSHSKASREFAAVIIDYDADDADNDDEDDDEDDKNDYDFGVIDHVGKFAMKRRLVA